MEYTRLILSALLNKKNRLSYDELHSLMEKDVIYNDFLKELHDLVKKEFIDNNHGIIINQRGIKKLKELNDSINLKNLNIEKQQEREDIEFEKAKVDLELAKKLLKEFPKTKCFARVGLFIAVVLALKELYILLSK